MFYRFIKSASLFIQVTEQNGSSHPISAARPFAPVADKV